MTKSSNQHTNETADKPARRYSKRRTDIVMGFCAGVILYTLIFRPEAPVAEVAIVWSFLTLVGCLGIYQGVGTLDLRALTKGK